MSIGDAGRLLTKDYNSAQHSRPSPTTSLVTHRATISIAFFSVLIHSAAMSFSMQQTANQTATKPPCSSVMFATLHDLRKILRR